MKEEYKNWWYLRRVFWINSEIGNFYTRMTMFMPLDLECITKQKQLKRNYHLWITISSKKMRHSWKIVHCWKAEKNLLHSFSSFFALCIWRYKNIIWLKKEVTTPILLKNRKSFFKYYVFYIQPELIFIIELQFHVSRSYILSS